MTKPKLIDVVVSAIARELGIRRESVVALIKSGALVAYDCSPPGAKRRSYRVTRQSLDDFKAGRSAKQTKTSRRKFVAKQTADFVEYFQ